VENFIFFQICAVIIFDCNSEKKILKSINRIQNIAKIKWHSFWNTVYIAANYAKEVTCITKIANYNHPHTQFVDMSTTI